MKLYFNDDYGMHISLCRSVLSPQNKDTQSRNYTVRTVALKNATLPKNIF